MTNIQKFTVTRGARRAHRFVTVKLGEDRARTHRSERRGLRLRFKAAVEEFLGEGEWDFDPNPPSRNSRIDVRDII